MARRHAYSSGNSIQARSVSMTRVKKALLWIVAPLLAMVLIAFAAAVITIRSDWFKNKVRERIVTIVEDSTGGRAEIGRFSYDWRRLTAEVGPFVLHGKEPKAAPPLVRADKIE